MNYFFIYFAEINYSSKKKKEKEKIKNKFQIIIYTLIIYFFFIQRTITRLSPGWIPSNSLYKMGLDQINN
jgi:hypothetical protein